MKTDRNMLEKELNIMISEYSKRKIKEEVIKEFAKRNFLAGDINNIFAKRTPVETLSQIMLCLFDCIFYENIESDERNRINPLSYFTELEIEQAKNFQQERKDITKYPIIFENVEKFNFDQWTTKMAAQEIAELYNTRVIIWNPETQREMKIKEYHNRIISDIDINKSSVSEIKTNILEGRFISNFISLNVLQNGEESIIYDEKSKDLTINSGEINILDGFHRSLGIIHAVRENPNIGFNIGVIISNFDIGKARRYIVQEDKRNKISTKHIKNLDADNLSNMIVKKINENSESYLKGRVTENRVLLNNTNALIMSDILSDTIQYVFKPENTMDVIKYSRWIIDGLNYIIELYPDVLYNKNDNEWVSYIIVLKQCFEDNNWQHTIKGVIDNIDKDRLLQLNPLKTVNKTTIKKIIEYIRMVGGNK